MVGACVGFSGTMLSAQVFMGDTGSLTLVGDRGAGHHRAEGMAVPIFCAVFSGGESQCGDTGVLFLIYEEQYGEGKRVFLMSPCIIIIRSWAIMKAKIATRFWIVTILCVAFAIRR